jgi:hypothetical protein
VFQPAGAEARWRTLYRVLSAAPTGETITYETLAAALNLPPDCDRGMIFGALRRAAQEHEELDKRAIESVRGVGYRVVHAADHLHLAHKHNQRASTQLELGISKVVNVDLSDVDPEIRKAFEAVASGLLQQREIGYRMENRQRRQARALAVVTQKQERTAEDVNELKRRLAESENRLAQIEATVKGSL